MMKRVFFVPSSICTYAGAALVSVLLAGCGGVPAGEATFPKDDQQKRDEQMQRMGKSASLFGKDGLILFGKKKEDAPATGVAVNSFLWRASLDTLSFMPLASADPFGGVIITEWYSPPEAPGSRFKANAYILDRELRADGVRVTLFQQRRDGNGGWNDAPVDARTATELENAILTRARQLRIDQTSSR